MLPLFHYLIYIISHSHLKSDVITANASTSAEFNNLPSISLAIICNDCNAIENLLRDAELGNASMSKDFRLDDVVKHNAVAAKGLDDIAKYLVRRGS